MPTAKERTPKTTKKATKKLSLRQRMLLLLSEHPAGLTRDEIVALGIRNGARRIAREEKVRETPAFEARRLNGSQAFTFRITPAGKREVAKLKEGELPNEELLQKKNSTEEVDGVIVDPVPLAVDIDVPPPGRVECKTNRIIRDTAKARKLKELHNHWCQICDDSICNGIYSEAHHLKPLGGDDPGPDIESNILVLCPDHHAMCDLALLPLVLANLKLHPKHRIAQEFIDYHNGLVEARLRK